MTAFAYRIICTGFQLLPAMTVFAHRTICTGFQLLPAMTAFAHRTICTGFQLLPAMTVFAYRTICTGFRLLHTIRPLLAGPSALNPASSGNDDIFRLPYPPAAAMTASV